jgi:hypothetical protein
MLGRDVRAGSGLVGGLVVASFDLLVFWSLHFASEDGEDGTTLSLVHRMLTWWYRQFS